MSAERDADLARQKARTNRLLTACNMQIGLRYWTVVNNSEVGLWYTAAAFVFFSFAGVLGLIIRAQLAVPDNDLLSAALYNQVFTLHGSIMMFLFAVPMSEAVAIILLPEMLGCRDLPSPR